MTSAAIMATEAALFQGEAAIGAGLADKIMNFQQAVAYIEEQGRSGGQSMKIFGFGAKAKPIATVSGEAPEHDLPEEVVDLQAILEQARIEGREQGRAKAAQQALETARTDERARISAIMDSCAAVSVQLQDAFSFSAELIKEGLTPQAASDRIIKAVADKSLATAGEITSTVTPTGSGEANPMLAEARKRAEASKKRGV
jgi:hypothetical protein